MPFVVNQGVKIYYEVEGHGPPIILAHGATGDMSFWRGYDYVNRLQDQFTVVLYDARAHGKSDKPHETDAYADQRILSRFWML